jgi:pimeloyl-ACP methyl ester carboxylesterase
VQDDTTGEKIKYLTMPVLILNGEADAVIPPANSLILARTIPHAQLVRWKTGGHAMIYQYPDEMATAINRFINSQASLN